MPNAPVFITCPKCDTKVDSRIMFNKGTTSCLFCKEPIPELQEKEIDWEGLFRGEERRA